MLKHVMPWAPIHAPVTIVVQSGGIMVRNDAMQKIYAIFNVFKVRQMPINSILINSWRNRLSDH